MGTLKEGLLGGFSGKVGNIVGVHWNGTYYVRSLPASVKDPKTESQMRQRSRFSVVMNFLKTITPFIKTGFQSYAIGRRSAFNAAMSYNIRNAVRVGQQGAELDWPNVLVSRGTLSTGLGAQTEIEDDGRHSHEGDVLAGHGFHAKVEDGELMVEWDAELSGNARGDDIAMLVVYNRTKSQSVYELNAGKRSYKNAVLQLPLDWRDDMIESYLAFKTADGSEVSDSVYLGGCKV